MKKVKVSKEIAEAIELFLAEYTTVMKRSLEDAKTVLIAEHCGRDWSKYEDGEYEALSGIATHELMTAMVVGYEIEKTSEEIILEQLRGHIESVKFYSDRRNLDVCEIEQERFSSGYVSGVKDIADAYGIKIEGVNA